MATHREDGPKNLQTVHVRVSDSASGRPTPVRVRFTDAEGQYFAPLGRLTQFSVGPNQDVGGNVLIGLKPYAYIDGTCEIQLPPGPIQVYISKGPEYVPLHETVNLVAGKLALRFAIGRRTNLREQGWYSGDGRAHGLSPHAALLEAAAEDLAVVNLLVDEFPVLDPYHKKVPTYPNLLAFSGQRPALDMPGHIVVVNTHNRHPELGSLGLLNCHRVVYPLSFGGRDGRDDWTLADWCDQCHRKGGLVVWTNTARESEHFVHGEPLADLSLGKVDAFEIDFFEDSPFDSLPRWYRLLNAGLRIPLIGSSGKDSNGKALGVMRTYARLESPKLTYKSWIEAVRVGRTFVTNGPLVQFTVNDAEPGCTLELPAPETVRVMAEARGLTPLAKLELMVNGGVAAEQTAGERTAAEQTAAGDSAAGDSCRARLEVELPIATTSWLAARCRGQEQILDRPANQRVFAHSSPVYVTVPGTAPPGGDEARRPLLADLDKMLLWARDPARSDPGQRQIWLDLFAAAARRLAR